MIGENLPRVDIPAKVTGGAAYVQDMRLPGMLHARVVRGPSDGTRLKPARHRRPSPTMPGVVQVVRDGSFTAVVADERMAGGQGAASPAGGRLGARRRAAAGTGHARGDPPPAGRRTVPIFDYPGPPAPADAHDGARRATAGPT